MGYLKKTGTVFIYVSFLLSVITFLPGLPPDATFSEYSIKPSTRLSGKLDINNRLNGIELLHVGELKAPETFDSFNGELYTGLEGGYIVKINENEVIPVRKIEGVCYNILKSHECGKVLGLKFDKKGILYIVDTYKGIFKIDPKGYYQMIVDISKPINNKVPLIPNSIDVAENGDLYWTDSSTDFRLYDGIYTSLANPSGRLIRYNAATKTNEVLIEDLMFANGVKLSKDESFLLLVESLSARIIKYHLKGPKAGQHEILLESLPGVLDNIQEDNNGGFLISLYGYIDEENPNLIQTLIPHPYIRKMLARLLMIIEAPFKLIQNTYPNFYTERMIHTISSLETFTFMFPKISVVLNLDATGKLVDAAYSTDGKANAISSAFIHKGYLWLGSPHNKFVGRVPLKQAFPNLAQKEIPKTHSTTVKPPKTVETPTVQTSTTTAKPVTKTPVTTSKPSTTTAPTTTVKPSTTTATPTTTVKPTTAATPTTTVKPSTASQTTQTLKVTTTTTTKPVVKRSAETATKPNNDKIKSDTVKPVAMKPNIPSDSTKQNVNVNKVTSENVKETKSEVNKKTVQNTQSKAQKQVQTPEARSNESPKTTNNNNIPK